MATPFGVSSRMNSTNVRSESPLDPWPLQPAPRSNAPACALTLWAAFVAYAAASGVFVRLEGEAYGALVIFVAVMAAWIARVDGDLAAGMERWRYPRAFVAVLDGVAIAGVLTARGIDGTHGGATWGSLVWLVLMPLALALQVASWGRVASGKGLVRHLA
jgi:hypothetical protein